ncbi:MAG: ABC transporter substrate-binding protein, partial [Litorimonas sp.]
MRRLAILLSALGLSACAETAPERNPSDRPVRIVSLDYCADQYVLEFADPEQVLAVSPDAASDFSYHRDAARGVPTVRPVAEDVLVLRPDLIVRAYGGGPGATGFFERAGIPVLEVGWVSELDGDGPGAIPSVLERMADGLGHPGRGAALSETYRKRLAALRDGSSSPAGPAALYMTPAGVTTGPGSLVHDMLVAAGLSNFQQVAGWHSLPLERLAYETPDLIAASFYETLNTSPEGWSASRHPI